MSKSSLIAAAVLLALAKAAAADRVQDAKSAGEKSETVRVTGIRASLKAPDVKRDSQTIVDVTISEDVGKFPDKNIAEALQSVSGGSISREYGEGERVSIRGTGANLRRAQLNGHDMATAKWSVPDLLTATGSFNY